MSGDEPDKAGLSASQAAELRGGTQPGTAQPPASMQAPAQGQATANGTAPQQSPQAAAAPSQSQQGNQQQQQPPQQQQQQQPAPLQQQQLTGTPLRVVPPALPHSAFARLLQHEGWRLLLATRLKYVLAAAMAVHGAVSTREPAGQGSGHAFAWRLTANFLGAVLPAAGVWRLHTAARAHAAVALNQLNRRLRQQLQQHTKRTHGHAHPAGRSHAHAHAHEAAAPAQHSQQEPLPPPQQHQQAQHPQLQHQQRHQQHQQHQQQHPHQQPQHAHGGGSGLVGAAKRKSSKPRSTQEALAAVAPPAGGWGGRGGRGGGAAAGAARNLRPRRRHQPNRLEAEHAAGKANQQRSGEGRRSRSPAAPLRPQLADIPLPDPLPPWGQQRRRDADPAHAPTLIAAGAYWSMPVLLVPLAGWAAAACTAAIAAAAAAGRRWRRHSQRLQ